MSLYDYRIASGHGVALVSLVNVETIVPTNDRAFAPPNTYGSYDPGVFRVRSDGTLYLAGFAFCIWNFTAITRAQYDYLQDIYCGASYSGKVTIYTRTEEPSTYARFNAIMVLPKLSELRKVTSGFADCQVRMVRLESI